MLDTNTLDRLFTDMPVADDRAEEIKARALRAKERDIERKGQRKDKLNTR